MAIVKNHMSQLTFLSFRFPFCWPCHEQTLEGIYLKGDECASPRKSVKTSRGIGESVPWTLPIEGLNGGPASSSVAEENASDILGKTSTCGGNVSKMKL